MADQASLRTAGARPADSNGQSTPEERVAGGLAGFGNDVATLAEFQARLALIDLKDCVNKIRVPVALIVLGLIAINGAVPVVLLGIATLLATALNLSTGWALLLTGGAVLAAAAGVAGTAAMKLGSGTQSFLRSREELTRNISWIKTVLLYSGRSVPRRSR
jgi:hypothetical protein